MTSSIFQHRSNPSERRDVHGYTAVSLPRRVDGVAWALRRAFAAERDRLPDDMQHLLDQLR